MDLAPCAGGTRQCSVPRKTPHAMGQWPGRQPLPHAQHMDQAQRKRHMAWRLASEDGRRRWHSRAAMSAVTRPKTQCTIVLAAACASTMGHNVESHACPGPRTLRISRHRRATGKVRTRDPTALRPVSPQSTARRIHASRMSTTPSVPPTGWLAMLLRAQRNRQPAA